MKYLIIPKFEKTFRKQGVIWDERQVSAQGLHSSVRQR